MTYPLDDESRPAPAAALPLLFRSMDMDATPAEQPSLAAALIDPKAIADDAREQGMLEGLRQTEARLQQMVQQERQGVTRALEEFVREKQRYFAGLEKEVVRLSLAIAERVLHREAGMDPLLLAGAARVALEDVKDDRDAVLRASPDDVGVWTDIMQREGRQVEVKADPSLTRGECLLETASGTAELGVRAQLQEIEHGFFELLGRKPAMAT